MTIRVFVEGLSAGERTLESEAARYLTRVHRLRPGETFVAFDPTARLETQGEILRIDREAVTVRLGASEPARAVPPLDVTLVQCAGKGDKVDDVVRSATALGVRAIVVAESARSVARVEGERAARRAERFRAVALDAARQSGRGDLPSVEGPLPFADAVSAFRDRPATKLCLDPRATASFASALAERHEREPSAPARTHAGLPIVLLVGPEGGLTDDELALADAAGFTRAKLGPFILRTELAGAAALAALIALSDPAP